MLALPAALSISALPAAAQTAADSAITDVELMQRADAARMYGTDTTRATIHEFVDFACSTCRAFYLERSDSLKAKYVESGGSFTRSSSLASCGATTLPKPPSVPERWRDGMASRECRAISSPTRQTGARCAGFVAYAEELGLAIEPFRDCLMRDAMAPLIMADMRTAGLARVPGTPTFVFLGPGQTNTEHQFYGNEPMVMFDQFLARVQ
jgi:protein-disulfide isomerase